MTIMITITVQAEETQLRSMMLPPPCFAVNFFHDLFFNQTCLTEVHSKGSNLVLSKNDPNFTQVLINCLQLHTNNISSNNSC